MSFSRFCDILEIMRFRKGSKVEVLSRKYEPSGSWRCAEIVCGNGHNYTVKYDGYADGRDEMLLERISRKAIRPSPPLPEVVQNWVRGDVIEVFNDFSWKMATVSDVLGKNYLMVRLLGSSLEFKVSKFDIRARQSWQDGKWVVIEKAFGNREDGKYGEKLSLKYSRHSRNDVTVTNKKVDANLEDDCCLVMNKEKSRESNIASSKTLKRKLYGYSQVDTYDSSAPKFRTIDKVGRKRRVIASNQYTLAEQVDPVALPPGEVLGAKFIHISLNNQSRFSEMDVERRKPTGDVGRGNNADTPTCSVGSCSITSKNSSNLQSSASFLEDISDNCSDAESFCWWGCQEGNGFSQTKEDLATEIHRLEMHAYRCTIEALHASGPLSWEQEALVTNLRLSLHISNDEHLTEVRNLVSADNNFASR